MTEHTTTFTVHTAKDSPAARAVVDVRMAAYLRRRYKSLRGHMRRGEASTQIHALVCALDLAKFFEANPII